MLKSMRKSKNRYFYHILVSPGDAPGAITLNVVWLEREFDAYKLSRSMYPSIFNSFSVIRTASAINRRFHVPQPKFLFPLEKPLRQFFISPCIRRPRQGGSRRSIGTPFGMGKLEWCRYPMVKKTRRYLYSFWRNSGT